MLAMIEASGLNAPPVNGVGPRKGYGDHAARLTARHRGAEYSAFGKIPAKVHSDGEPQAARGRIGDAEQYAGLESNCNDSDGGRAGIETVRQAKQRRGNDQGGRRTEPFLRDTKNSAAKQQLPDSARQQRSAREHRLGSTKPVKSCACRTISAQIQAGQHGAEKDEAHHNAPGNSRGGGTRSQFRNPSALEISNLE